jgi:MFS family permease
VVSGLAETEVAAGTAAADAGRRAFGTTIVAGHTLKHFYISSLSAVFMPEIKIGLGLSNAQVGTLGSVQQFSGWFATMTAGYLGDRFTSKTGLMLALSLAMMGTGYLCLGLFETYGLLIVAILIAGVGVSVFHPPALGALARHFPERRSFVIMMHGAGGSVGEVLGPLIVPTLIAVVYWQDLLKLSFFPALVAAFLMFRLLQRPDRGDGGGGAASFPAYVSSLLTLLRQRAMLMICLVTGLRSVGQATIGVFLPIYLREDLGYSAGLVGLYIALAQVAGIGSQPLMGLLADRFSHKAVLVPALALFALLLLIVPLADGKAQLAVVILLLGCFLFSLHALLISAAIELAGREVQSTTVSLIYASSFIGALAPTIAGLLADAYGLESTFLFASALVASSMTILILTRLPKRGAGSP